MTGPSACPVLVATRTQAVVLTAQGEVKTLSFGPALEREVGGRPTILCHTPSVFERIGKTSLHPLDVLDLFVFVHPARFCIPSPRGLAQALGLGVPETHEDEPLTLLEVAQTLLADLAQEPEDKRNDTASLARLMGMGGKGWGWTPSVLQALGKDLETERPEGRSLIERHLKKLPELAESGPQGTPGEHPITEEEMESRLTRMLHGGTNKGVAEDRADQRAYLRTVGSIFTQGAPVAGSPQIVLAQAGTGIGKTLGYLAPATLWAETNDDTVWISTYTRNLQKQLDQELQRLSLTPEDRARYAVIRKGRENYLCLLNYAEFAAAALLKNDPRGVVAAGLMLRWIMQTRDGDLSGADFSGWLTTVLGIPATLGLSDRRGECLHAGCEFYHRCFVERSIRRAKKARIVVANHALVMSAATMAGEDDSLPTRYIFDEGHHLLDAADQAFSLYLTVQETAELRRWLVGAEGGKRTRARGLRRRLEDLLSGDEKALDLVDRIDRAARALPAERILARLKDGNPVGPVEALLHQVATWVTAQTATTADPAYSAEATTRDLPQDLLEAAQVCEEALQQIEKPMRVLTQHFAQKLANGGEENAPETRKRLQMAMMGLDRRARGLISGWRALLSDMQTGSENKDFVDWLEITRSEGEWTDVGVLRHWRNPMVPFAEVMGPHVRGAVMTSATLCDREGGEGWTRARQVTGADLLTPEPKMEAFPSPFDYPSAARVIVITDLHKDSPADLARALSELCKASGGGALALFTAVRRLKVVYEKLAEPLENAGLNLYAQHVDRLDNGTLVDLLRADPRACLLGTDALRDGVDVPGSALRLLVMDRVPWPVARILHKARREIFGGRNYDEQLVRLRLKQAFGRLIRRAGDRGVFVLLDSSLPSRLADAFPPGVQIERLPLGQAVLEIRNFLNPDAVA